MGAAPQSAPAVTQPTPPADRPEPHRYAVRIASAVREAPATWFAEDAALVVSALASRLNECSPAINALAVEALDRCADALDTEARR